MLLACGPARPDRVLRRGGDSVQAAGPQPRASREPPPRYAGAEADAREAQSAEAPVSHTATAGPPPEMVSESESE